jgi:hypothetical protein
MQLSNTAHRTLYYTLLCAHTQTGCPAGYKGDRCEIAPTGTVTTTRQTCTPPETGGACQNGSRCTLNSAGYIYCAGAALTCPLIILASAVRACSELATLHNKRKRDSSRLTPLLHAHSSVHCVLTQTRLPSGLHGR